MRGSVRGQCVGQCVCQPYTMFHVMCLTHTAPTISKGSTSAGTGHRHAEPYQIIRSLEVSTTFDARTDI